MASLKCRANANLAAIFLTGIFANAAQATQEDKVSEVIALETETLFVPQGFDDNDRIEIFLDGWLPNTCAHLVESAFKLNPETLTIEVEARARREDHICLPVLTRFTAVVSLGRLPMGDYTVVANAGALTEDLVVTEATSAGPDDHLYASVTNAFVDFAPDYAAKNNSRFSVVVEGEFTDSCQRLEELRVKDSGKTFEVLPIIAREGDECLTKTTPFVARGELREFSEPGRYLLHVRKYNGSSLNRVFNVYDQH